jgi:small subunit ribosomal protein S4
MSKYLGSVLKKLRALGLPLPRFRNKGNNPPGQHGAKRKRRKSSYGLQLQEKQKVIYSYGWRDKQLKNEYIKAKSKVGDAGVNLLVGSESRLDNLIFKSGLLNTIDFAREWVSHGHFLVNGEKVKIPSYKVEPGQVISLKKEKMKENKLVKSNLEKNTKIPPYIAFDKQELIITYLRYPTREELNKDIDIDAIVGWYNRKV